MTCGCRVRPKVRAAAASDSAAARVTPNTFRTMARTVKRATPWRVNCSSSWAWGEAAPGVKTQACATLDRASPNWAAEYPPRQLPPLNQDVSCGGGLLDERAYDADRQVRTDLWVNAQEVDDVAGNQQRRQVGCQDRQLHVDGVRCPGHADACNNIQFCQMQYEFSSVRKCQYLF